MNRALLPLAALCAVLLNGCGDAAQHPPTTVTVTRTRSAATPTQDHAAAAGLPSPAHRPRGVPGTPRGLPKTPNPDRSDPVAVADALLLTLWSSDTAIDADPHAAAVRAQTWMTPQLASANDAPRYGGPGADWYRLKANHGYYQPSIRPHANPTQAPAGETTITLTRTVTVLPHGDRDWLGDLQTWRVTLTLTRPSATGPWSVNAITMTADPSIDLDIR